MKEDRTFLLSRASSFVEVGTGMIIEDALAHFIELHFNSDEAKVKSILKLHDDEIKILKYFARADGRAVKENRLKIEKYIETKINSKLNHKYVDENLKINKCDRADFISAIQSIKNSGRGKIHNDVFIAKLQNKNGSLTTLKELLKL
ncbi:MAG: hypothetical protein ACXVCP_13945 [Bdellovibrio sp.]